MAMLHKWATGNHEKDNTKNDSAGNAVIQSVDDFAYELANTEPTDAAYTREKAKSYSAAGKYRGGSKKKLEWYNILRMWKWRKIHKTQGKHGAALYKA